MRALRLSRRGPLVTIVGDAPEEKASKYGVKGFSILVEPNRNQLVEIGRLVDAGEVKPVVDAVYPLSRAREAYEKGLGGHSRGKTVLMVGNDWNS